MNITNILGGLSDALPLSKRADSAEASATQTKADPPAATSPAGQAAALREILAKYDVSRITPGQFSQMVQKLYSSGAITAQEYQDLSAVRVDLDAAGVSPDETVNLVELYRDKVHVAQRQADDPDSAVRQQVGPLLRRLDWLEKFATMHAQPDALGLATLA